MEFRVHILVLGILAIYTAVLVLLVYRNMHALRTHHACSDVSTPLAKAVSSLLQSGGKAEGGGALFEALGSAGFHAVRILVFDASGDRVLFDTHEPGPPRPPSETQQDVRRALDAAGAPTATLLLHRPTGTKLAHVAGKRCDNGMLVITEALAS